MESGKRIILLALTLAWSGTTLACPHNQQQFMCPGDPVVDGDGDSGTVRAINPFQDTVAIYEPSHGRNYDFSIQEVALGLGCLEGYCVNDFAVDSDGDSGTIVAVNPYSRQVAIYEPSHGKNYLFSVEEVSLGLGCMEGYCVGDLVTDGDGDNGKIIAINRYAGQAAVREPSHGKNYVFDIRTLASSEYCATYGNHERSARLYPEFRTDTYISADLHFTLTRPVR